MAQVTINNRSIAKEFKENQKIEDIFDFITENELKESQIITEVNLDGNTFHIDEQSTWASQTINEFKEVQFVARTSMELAVDALASCSNYIDYLNSRILVLTALYQENKIDEANATFSEVIEILDLFVQLIGRIHKTFRENHKESITKAEVIQNLEIHLLSVLKALLPAKERGDIIMLCDLLEYELVDNLTQWKIKAIPALKKISEV